MKKFLALAAALGTLAVAAPASAQYHNGRGYDRGRDFNINAEQRRLDQRIYAGQRNGRISYREAGRLRAEFAQIARLEARYRSGGLNRWERTDLTRRLDRLDAMVTAELRDRDNRRG